MAVVATHLDAEQHGIMIKALKLSLLMNKLNAWEQCQIEHLIREFKVKRDFARKLKELDNG